VASDIAWPAAADSSKSRLIYTDLATAARDNRELVEPHLQSLVRPSEWKLQALQGALRDAGAFIYVPRGHDVELPVMHLVESSRSAYFPHLLVVAEAGSSLTVVQETRSRSNNGQSLISGAVEIIAGPDASVRFVEVQRWDEQAYAFSTIRARLDRGASLTAGLIGLGSRLSKTKLEVDLVGEGASAELLGLSLGKGRQHFDYTTLQNHIAPHTSSDLMFKAALDDHSSNVWNGTVRIHKGASQSEANQTSRNLLLSDTAKAAPIPVLEIEAYDVLRCSHGATAGPLDEEQRFYLESRGIPPAEAERLLVEAFFREVIDRLPVESLRESVTASLMESVEAHA
jgi:Fe-S cluster assembly protein SufD